MAWEWHGVLLLVRIVMAVVPAVNLPRDFALGTFKEEAREFATASASIGIIITVVPAMALQLLAHADRACDSGVSLIWTIIMVFIVLGASWGLWQKLRPSRFRSIGMLVIVLICATIVDVLWQVKGAGPIAQALCNTTAGGVP